MVRDAVAAMTNDPLRVHDLNLDSNGRQKHFIPFNAAWGEVEKTGFEGTRVVETDASSGTGAVFYVVVSCYLGTQVKYLCNMVLIVAQEFIRQ